ncbi:MAG: hypothetical protein WDN66_05610 [Candidatus Saccharibacteria bacterium]
MKLELSAPIPIIISWSIAPINAPSPSPTRPILPLNTNMEMIIDRLYVSGAIA